MFNARLERLLADARAMIDSGLRLTAYSRSVVGRGVGTKDALTSLANDFEKHAAVMTKAIEEVEAACQP